MCPETFESLLKPVLPAIRKFVRAKIAKPDYAEDVVQQTLMLAFAHREQLRVHAKFKSWLASIAMNEIRGLANRTPICVSLDELPAMPSSARWTCPHKVFEDGERSDRIHAGLARLKPGDRRTIQLMDLAEVGLVDAAKLLEVLPAALKSTHYRARQRLNCAMRAKRKTCCDTAGEA